ncbi:hypothetical protein GQ600_10685 [Phytophthora cactorum]|nr:hypothetical protein GQ600_10685 [Phytophthora cactorum]
MGSRNGGDGDTDAGSIRSGASSAADSALSFASVSSVGSHNSAASIGNFSIQSLSMATASHFLRHPSAGECWHSLSSRETEENEGGQRRREAYVEQQLSELRPNAALAREVGCVLEMLVFLGHVQQAQKLQTQLAGFEKCVADKKMPISPRSAADKAATCNEGQDYEHIRSGG